MYIVYKTTNQINGRFYIGVHCGRDQRYLGSGKALKRAIAKWGRDCFIRETLASFDQAEDAFLYEAELLTPSMLSNPLCYNMMPGGRGLRKGVSHSATTKQKISQSHIGRKQSSLTKERRSKSLTGLPKPPGFGAGVASRNSARAPSYRFCHPTHGVFEGTTSQMLQLYPDLDRSALRSVHHERPHYHQHKGWRKA